jgi:hypothetical protein
MAIKVPVRTVYDASNNAIGLSEFQSGEAVGYLHGGTGLTTIGTANQILKVNGDGNALEWAADAQSNLNPYLEVANAAAIYATKSYAAANTYVNAQIGASNTSIRQYINSEIGSSNTSIRQYVNAQIGSSNTNIRAYTDQTYVTKAVALSSNNALVNLVNDRLQVANAVAIYATKAYAAANTYVNAQIGASNTSIRQYINSEIGSSNTNIRSYTDQTYVTKSVALTSNNELNSLILDRMQVANVSTLVTTEVSNLVDSAPETLNTLNELAAALGDDQNFAATTAASLGTKAANTYVNQTFATKATALSSNNALLGLINDRIQVANVASALRSTFTTTASNTTIDSTYHNNGLIINAANNVTLTITQGTNLDVGDKFNFYSVGTGDVTFALSGSDTYLGTEFSSLLISTVQETQVTTVQANTFNSESNLLSVKDGLFSKVEIVFVGSGKFILTV